MILKSHTSVSDDTSYYDGHMVVDNRSERRLTTDVSRNVLEDDADDERLICIYSLTEIKVYTCHRAFNSNTTIDRDIICTIMLMSRSSSRS